MNATEQLVQKKKSGKEIAVIVLITAICVLLSLVLLGQRLQLFTATDYAYGTIINLTGETVSTEDETAEGTDTGSNGQGIAPQMTMEKLDAGFAVEDEDGTWKTSTAVDIFKTTYKNGEQQITVAGPEKILAPGTENSYSFMLENTGDVPVSYEMKVDAYLSNNIERIPVVAKIYDHEGNYLSGSEDKFVPVLDIAGVEDKQELAVDHYWDYTLEWQWPFEEDDAYDTFLGDEAVTEDMVLTIEIQTVATAEDEILTDGGIPKTGDETQLNSWIFLGTAALLAMALMVLTTRGRKEQEDEA